MKFPTGKTPEPKHLSNGSKRGVRNEFGLLEVYKEGNSTPIAKGHNISHGPTTFGARTRPVPHAGMMNDDGQRRASGYQHPGYSHT